VAIEIEMILRLLLAAALGAVIGYQRERASKPAGLRTHTLICIGAGAIIRRGEGVVEGVTTAATIWAVAAIGLAAGAGLYLVSAITAALILIVLFLPHPIR